MPDEPSNYAPEPGSADLTPRPMPPGGAGEASPSRQRRMARRRAQVRKKLRDARVADGEGLTAGAASWEDGTKSGNNRQAGAPLTLEDGRGTRGKVAALKGRRLSWWRKAVPAAGLALCAGCLWALSGLPWPDWPLPWGRSPGVLGNVAVIIDPGHGGGDTGAVAQGVVEKDLNLDVGLRIGRMLRARGVPVRLTREDDHFVTLEDRVRFANALPGAVFVSIHFNDASGDGQATGRASGVETYYCEHKLTPMAGWTWTALLGRARAGVPDARRAVREGQALADAIQGALVTGTRAENRGIKERSLYVTHRVSGPAVLVEGGFVSHPGEARKLGDPAYRQVLAECIAEGIVKYLRTPRPAGELVAATGKGSDR